MGALLRQSTRRFWLHSRPYYEGVTPEEYLSNVPVPITEVHVHDNDGTRDAHRPLGTGTNDIQAAARGLSRAGFDGTCTIEVRVPDSIASRAAAVALYAGNMQKVRSAMAATGAQP